MKTLITKGIVLSRTDYGEADRIITVITPDHGKLRLIVKGVRRMKSKMAGGIELFSINQLTYIKGRGEISTMISARSDKYYSHIVDDIDRVQLGYEIIKKLNKATEDNTEKEYYLLLHKCFQALDDPSINIKIIECWFRAQLLSIGGYEPNLISDNHGEKLVIDKQYNFDVEEMYFIQNNSGQYGTDSIKLLRLFFSKYSPIELKNIRNLDAHIEQVKILVNTIYSAYIRT